MMAGDRVPSTRTGGGTLHHVLQWPVVLLHVEVGSGKSFHPVAQVLGNGECLEEYLREDDRAPDVDENPPVAEIRDHGGQ